jgi:hypothetical protein
VRDRRRALDDSMDVTPPRELEPLLLNQVRLEKRMWRMGALMLAAIMILCGGLAKLFLSSAESQGIAGLASMGLVVSLVLALSTLGDHRWPWRLVWTRCDALPKACCGRSQSLRHHLNHRAHHCETRPMKIGVVT